LSPYKHEDGGPAFAGGAWRRRALGWWNVFAFTRILKSPLPLRLVALALMVGVYCSFEWTLLRTLLGGLAVAILSGVGHQAGLAASGDQIFLSVDGARFSILAACTYVDLALTLAPFTWRMGRPLGSNLMRVFSVILAVLAMNVARVVLAIHLHTTGAGWSLAHDAPDHVLYFTALFAALLLSARSDGNAPSWGNPPKGVAALA